MRVHDSPSPLYPGNLRTARVDIQLGIPGLASNQPRLPHKAVLRPPSTTEKRIAALEKRVTFLEAELARSNYQEKEQLNGQS